MVAVANFFTNEWYEKSISVSKIGSQSYSGSEVFTEKKKKVHIPREQYFRNFGIKKYLNISFLKYFVNDACVYIHVYTYVIRTDRH